MNVKNNGVDMTLSELKESIDSAVESADGYGISPDEIQVSFQVFIWDGKDCTKGKEYWANKEVEVHYDNDGLASGCVITASREASVK